MNRVHAAAKALIFVTSSLWGCLAFGGADLEAKLNSQFQRYDQARKELTTRVGCGGPAIPRDEWEKLLTPPSSQGLTNEDLSELSRRHAADAKAGREKAVMESSGLGIDLREIKTKQITDIFCSGLPKGAMLHVHPDGTLTKARAYRLLKGANPRINRSELLSVTAGSFRSFSACELNLIRTLPESKKFSELSDPEKELVASLVAMAPSDPDAKRFQEFEAKFSYIKFLKNLLGSASSEDPSLMMISEHLSESKDHKVSHVEFTKGCAPSDEGLSSINSFVEAAGRKSGVSVRHNCAFARTMSSDAIASEARSIFSALLERQKSNGPLQRISGIDLFGAEDPADNPGRDVSAFGAGQRIWACLNQFKEKKGLKLNSTMHAGEFGDLRNPRDALIMGVDRIGHGVLLSEDPLAVEYARRRGVGIEANLVSNESLGSVSSLKSHPFLHYLRLGIPVSLSTDDDGILQTDPNRECTRAIQETDITYFEIKQLSYNSIRNAFLSEAEKTALKKQLDVEFKGFESQWSIHSKSKLAGAGGAKRDAFQEFTPRNSCMDRTPNHANAPVSSGTTRESSKDHGLIK